VVNRKELWKEGNRLEAELSAFCRLAEYEEGDGTENNGASSDTSSLRFLELFHRFVEVQLELSLFGEFGDDVMIVRVKPEKVVEILVLRRANYR
jgi:hypothetical protein